jgi:hypothetical protein
MTKLFILTIILYLTTFQVRATEYLDYIVADNYIWGLTSNGTINLFDISTGKKADKKIPNSSQITILTKDKEEFPIIADKNREIKKYNSIENSWTTIAKYDCDISGIVFDSKGVCYAITNNGIIDLSTKKKYFTTNSLNHQIHFKESWSYQTCYFIDRKNNIWIGFAFGEWGGELIIFNTTDKKFITPSLNKFEIALWPIKSFFEDSSSVYLSSGLMHFETSGTIVKFENFNATVLFDSESHWEKPTEKDSVKQMINGEYIGPATFNYFNNSIYFYSHNGIFRGNKSKDLSKIENWEKVLQPKLKWKSGQPDAIGSPMNVLKLSIIDINKFVFLSQNDGIGFFDGKQLILIN